jgi:competence protein ComGC
VHKGFTFIALLLALAIIALLFAAYFRSENGNNNVIKTGQQAEKSLEQSNENLNIYQNQLNEQQQNIEIQNELNSIY